MTAQMHRTRNMLVASGEPSTRARYGADAYSPTYNAVLAIRDRVNTVRAKLRTSPSQRTIAALTPSSFVLSRTASTTCDTAYRPYTVGPNTVRASTTPTAKPPTRTTMLFSALHRVPDRTLLSRSGLTCSSADGVAPAGTRARGGKVTASSSPGESGSGRGR